MKVKEQGKKGNLKKRHLEMISLGSAIGTGIFLVSSETIQMAGPAVMLSYAIAGFVIFLILRMLGEMTIENPDPGSYCTYAEQYWGKLPGFIVGWNWWYTCIVVSMLELTAACVFMDYWFPHLPHWITVLVLLSIIYAVNMINAKAFGEFEFWFSLIKVMAVLLIIVLGIAMILGIKGGKPTGFSNLWAHGGFFPKGAKGVLFALLSASFAFGGIESIGTTAGETEDLETTLPKSINKIFWLRVLIFYIGAIGVILIIWPWTKIAINTSPFVMAMDGLGIKSAAAIMNIVCIIACLSVFNCMVFSNPRILCSLAQNGSAPKFLTKKNKAGVPTTGLKINAAITLLVVVLNYFFPHLFNYLVSIVLVSEIITWSAIAITNIHFHKKLGKKASELKFKVPFYPYSNYFCLAYLALLLVLMIIVPSYRIGIIALPIWLCVLFIGYKFKQMYDSKSVSKIEESNKIKQIK